jgi:hypothetical protein
MRLVLDAAFEVPVDMAHLETAQIFPDMRTIPTAM